MVHPALICPVRGCRLPLVRSESRTSCPRGHSFDVARSGYINLLQPQDRRSRRPGDPAEVAAARRRFAARGFSAPLVAAIIGLLTIDRDDAVLDVGCGEGHHLAAIADWFGCEGHGVDISVAAIATAAKHYPPLHWIIANADRFVPYAEGSFRVVLSITARMNAPEFRRVLHENGRLLIAVPAPDDLIELRQAVLGEGILRDRVQRTVTAFTPLFRLERHERIRHREHLDRAAVRDAMTSAYRALRERERARLASIPELGVTLSRDVLLFRPA